MTISKDKIKLLHVAKSKLRLSDDAYRLAMIRLAGVDTSLELDADGFDVLMAYFRYLGFDPIRRTGVNYGERPGMASHRQLQLIREMFREWSGCDDEDGRRAWLRRFFKVDSERFLTVEGARGAITALKSMKATKARHKVAS